MNVLKATIRICIFAIILISSSIRSQQQSVDNSSIFGPDAGQKHNDLDILNPDVESVLKIISDTSGWTIIPSQKVSAKVSLWSKSATARQLWEKLSLVNDDIYRQEENVFYLITKDEYEVLSDELYTNTEKRFSNNHRRIQHHRNTELSRKAVEKAPFL